MDELVICPDVHGRDFWRPVADSGLPMVFLGDYLDPYPTEGITPGEALIGFKDILELKKSRPTEVTLLLGNHDVMYLNPWASKCRTDIDRYSEIQDLFLENLDLFQVISSETVGGVKYLFSHAPILPEWVMEVWDTEHPDLGAVRRNLEEWLHTEKFRPHLWSALEKVSWWRGGPDEAGSPVWADVRELGTGRNLWPGYHCVFGHTQLREPLFDQYWSCLDARRAFIATPEGDIKEKEDA